MTSLYTIKKRKALRNQRQYDPMRRKIRSIFADKEGVEIIKNYLYPSLWQRLLSWLRRFIYVG